MSSRNLSLSQQRKRGSTFRSQRSDIAIEEDPYKKSDSDSMSNFLKLTRNKSGSAKEATNEKSDSADILKQTSPRLSDSGSFRVDSHSGSEAKQLASNKEKTGMLHMAKKFLGMSSSSSSDHSPMAQ